MLPRIRAAAVLGGRKTQYSNGVWWDVGNRDRVFVNNWVENAVVGF